MPDWSYTTLTGPTLRRLDHDRGRRFVNGFFRFVNRIPHGYRIVDLLGHMHPDPDLARPLPNGVRAPSATFLMPCIDPRGDAAAAFSRFGVGGLTFGPVTTHAADVRDDLTFRQGCDGSILGNGGPALSLDDAVNLANETGSAEFLFELDPWSHADPKTALIEMVSALAPTAAALVLSSQGYDRLSALDENAQDELLQTFGDVCATRKVAGFVSLPLTISPKEAILLGRACAGHGLSLGLSGARHADGSWQWGGDTAQSQALALLSAVREELPDLCVWADGGVLSPRDAKELSDEGADFIGLGPGLVHTGPGLAKRINETLHYFILKGSRRPSERDHETAMRRPWMWGLLLGLSMLFGAILAGWSALTTVLLPYDEEFLGRTAADIAEFNPRVLKFMTHDRITLAGTMVSVGILYCVLSWRVIRRGQSWAQHVVIVSAGLGALSFFAFLGFGYLDPFHAFVTTILLQFLIQVAVRKIGPKRQFYVCPRLDNDVVWRRALWGQLLFVVHGGSLILAGATILTFGMSVVFVPQDITYLGCDAASIHLFDAQLQSLIAHDRATFGGMLLSAGAALLLTSMWSFRHGDRWLFWTLGTVILAPYMMTLWIHWDIGYHDHFHLTPVYIGLCLLFGSLILSRQFLLSRRQAINPAGR